MFGVSAVWGSSMIVKLIRRAISRRYLLISISISLVVPILLLVVAFIVPRPDPEMKPLSSADDSASSIEVPADKGALEVSSAHEDNRGSAEDVGANSKGSPTDSPTAIEPLVQDSRREPLTVPDDSPGTEALVVARAERSNDEVDQVMQAILSAQDDGMQSAMVSEVGRIEDPEARQRAIVRLVEFIETPRSDLTVQAAFAILRRNKGMIPEQAEAAIQQYTLIGVHETRRDAKQLMEILHESRK